MIMEKYGQEHPARYNELQSSKPFKTQILTKNEHNIYKRNRTKFI